ncbi:MAG: hypothetical protein JW809_10065 [Pirellulales bacterium]|nr:hypothetical protein [Pirellulales bacterium]
MRRILQRGLLPVVLLAVGIASLAYGVGYHRREVLEEQEIEIDVMPPEMPPDVPPEDMGGPPGADEFGGPPGFGEPSDFGPPGAFGPPALPPELRKIKQIILVGIQEPEMRLVRDVTVGGLARLESGELKRTYTGEPPSLCPT